MRAAGKQRSFGSKVMTGAQAQHALGSLLRDCRDEQLRGFTAEGLAGSYKVPIAKCAEMLARAKRERGE